MKTHCYAKADETKWQHEFTNFKLVKQFVKLNKFGQFGDKVRRISFEGTGRELTIWFAIFICGFISIMPFVPLLTDNWTMTSRILSWSRDDLNYTLHLWLFREPCCLSVLITYKIIPLNLIGFRESLELKSHHLIHQTKLLRRLWGLSFHNLKLCTNFIVQYNESFLQLSDY